MNSYDFLQRWFSNILGLSAAVLLMLSACPIRADAQDTTQDTTDDTAECILTVKGKPPVGLREFYGFELLPLPARLLLADIKELERAADRVIESAPPVRAEAQQRDVAVYLRPQHSAVVEKWLAGRPNFRLASEADCVNKDGLEVTRNEQGRNYNPYYTVGDFNGDGKEDFAVALVKKRRSKWPFTVAIFNGPLKGNSVPAFTMDDDLSRGGLFYKAENKPSDGRLIVGDFESDNCVILRPRGKTYLIKDCIDD